MLFVLLFLSTSTTRMVVAVSVSVPLLQAFLE